MNDLELYHHLHARISELECENEKLRKKLKTSQTLCSKHKVKWQKLYEQHNPPIVTRSDKAIILIKQKHAGELDITLRQIAKQCFISYSHARCLSTKLRKSLKQ